MDSQSARVLATFCIGHRPASEVSKGAVQRYLSFLEIDLRACVHACVCVYGCVGVEFAVHGLTHFFPGAYAHISLCGRAASVCDQRSQECACPSSLSLLTSTALHLPSSCSILFSLRAFVLGHNGGPSSSPSVLFSASMHLFSHPCEVICKRVNSSLDCPSDTAEWEEVSHALLAKFCKVVRVVQTSGGTDLAPLMQD